MRARFARAKPSEAYKLARRGRCLEIAIPWCFPRIVFADDGMDKETRGSDEDTARVRRPVTSTSDVFKREIFGLYGRPASHSRQLTGKV